jgi:hypothetical protein
MPLPFPEPRHIDSNLIRSSGRTGALSAQESNHEKVLERFSGASRGEIASQNVSGGNWIAYKGQKVAPNRTKLDPPEGNKLQYQLLIRLADDPVRR